MESSPDNAFRLADPQAQFSIVFPGLLYAGLGYVLFRSGGHYRTEWVLYLLGFLVLSLWTWARPARRGLVLPEIPLLAILIFFSLINSRTPDIVYATQGKPLALLADLLRVSLALAIALAAIWYSSAGRRWSTPLAVLAVGLLFVERALVLIASPHPLIDVFVFSNQAAAHLLAGRNPYTQIYPDIYHGKLDTPIFIYLPGLLYWTTPFYAVFHDIRVAFVASDAVTTVALLKLARKCGLTEPARWLVVLGWLSLPVSLFVLEQAWLDPMMVMWSALLAVSLALGFPAWSGAFMGALVATKQYGIVIAFLTLCWIWPRYNPVRKIRLLSSFMAVVLVFLLPFLLWDSQAFFDHTVHYLAAHKLRLDSLSAVVMVARETNYFLPGWLTGGLALGAALSLGYGLGKQSYGLPELSASIAILFLVIFIFGKMAFCNYYYLTLFFIWLWAMATWAPLDPLSGRERR